MKYIVSLCALVLCVFSCNKDISDSSTKTTDPQNYNYIADSCSYTIEGKQYICNKPFTEGKGNAGANFDIVTKKWDVDTLQYRIMYGFIKTSNVPAQDDGSFVISFVKKYNKNQLIKPLLGIIAPDTDTTLYLKGIQQYAVDYDRSNSQNGIVLSVLNKTDTSVETLITYIGASVFSPTTLNNDSQKDAQFEILKVTAIPEGGHIIEAKFTANLFNKDEKLKRLQNGYLRIHVD